ncbi:FAD binding domain-containing protein [Euzebya tangerina]|uniref:FAD binding domain-containing protein n=1 Tax=Euzebya tangerina TaxID=591198 RepID=UPI000E31AC02|nr:FAD binding domain-containing protein [Euzebya tangerina]
MIPAPFAYVAPDSIDEVLELLAQHGDEAAVLAGGHSLIPQLRLRQRRPGLVIDLRRVAGLDAVERTNDGVRIGPRVTVAQLARHDAVRESAPLVRAAAPHVADPLVRGRSTLVGALAEADPASDWVAVALALNAQLVLRSSGGERQLDIQAFLNAGAGEARTARRSDELVTAVTLPRSTAIGYARTTHPASGWPLAAVGVSVEVDDAGVVSSARIGVSGAFTTPQRASAAEERLVGSRLDAATVREAGGMATEDATFAGDADDLHGPPAHRRRILPTVLGRAVARISSH